MKPEASSRQLRIRAILILVFPTLLICAAVTAYAAATAATGLARAEVDFGEAIVDQLALTTVDYLVNEDVLSLNIMMRDLLAKGYFNFAAIHDDDSQLIAQVGLSGEGPTFIQDITFQNTVVGHLRVQLDAPESVVTSIVGLAALLTLTTLSVLGGAVWFYGDLLFIWITGEHRHADSAEPARKKGLPVVAMPGGGSTHRDTCWMTIKLKPERLVEAHRSMFEAACQLYGGKPVHRVDDMTVTFATGEHVHNSIRCALLIRTLAERLPGNINFRAGIDIGEDDVTVPKHSAYLASVSDSELLVSRRVRQRALLQPSSYLELSEYHHSLIAAGEVFSVSIRSDHPLIDQQATHLLGE